MYHYHKYKYYDLTAGSSLDPFPFFAQLDIFMDYHILGILTCTEQTTFLFFSFNCLFYFQVNHVFEISWNIIINHGTIEYQCCHSFIYDDNFYVSFQEKQGNNALTRACLFFTLGLWIWNQEWTWYLVFYHDLCFFYNNCYRHDQVNICSSALLCVSSRFFEELAQLLQHRQQVTWTLVANSLKVVRTLLHPPTHLPWAEARMCNIHVNNCNRWNAQKGARSSYMEKQ